MGHPRQQLMRVMRSRVFLLASLAVSFASPLTAAEEAVHSEADAYALHTLAIQDEAFLEVGALAWLPGDRLAVGTRRGEIWIVEHPAADEPRWSRFAHGLHEVLGLAWKVDAAAGQGGGWLYATHRPEVSRLADADGDGVADRFETVADGCGVSGDYH